MDYFHKTDKDNRLVILDDFYPHILTGFRIAEYNYYLEQYKESKVYSSNVNFEVEYGKFLALYPKFASKVEKLNVGLRYSADLVYTVFLNNAYHFLPIIEENKVPFVFTLYPGGGFNLNQPESDMKLQVLFSSEYFRKVIVTQNVTYAYLINNGFCTKDSIEFIYGVVLNNDVILEGLEKKKFYFRNKKQLDICFCAMKYMEKGKDKGYDLFVEAAKKLKWLENIKFHVIGGFSDEDIDVSELGNKIQFYGHRSNAELRSLFNEIDIIISPNRPFVLYPGAFDGFPTACCSEAMQNGVVVFCSDELGLNKKLNSSEEIYQSGRDLCIIPNDADKIAEMVIFYYLNPERIIEVAANALNKMTELYDVNVQMGKRRQILDEFIKK